MLDPFVLALRHPEDGADQRHVKVLCAPARTSMMSRYVHQPVPHARLLPAHHAVLAGCPRSIALGKITPRRTRTQQPENAVQNPPVITPRAASRPVRQQRRDHAPLDIGQNLAAHATTLNQINNVLEPVYGSTTDYGGFPPIIPQCSKSIYFCCGFALMTV